MKHLPMSSHSTLKSFTYLCLGFLLVFTACEKNECEEPFEAVLPTADLKIAVSCEGAFGASNASLSIYEKDSVRMSTDIYNSVNGVSPGDVMQSISSYGDELFLILNGSGTIEVVNDESYVNQGTISGLHSPRVMLPVSDSKAYVSNIYSDEVQIINPSTRALTGAINVGAWSEGMLLVGDELWVTLNNDSAIFIIDTVTDEIIDSVATGPGPKDLARDANGDVWLLSYSFDLSFNTIAAQLSRINPVSRVVESVQSLPQPWSYEMDMRLNGAGTQVYVLNSTVYQMGIADTELESLTEIDVQSNFYGLGVDPDNGDIYLGYVASFSGPGVVYRYSADTQLIDEQEVGIAPNFFCFFD